MNSGGEPERDDTGLPPVDIEIPGDARELDRDVQAYYREQRALRRQQRRSRLHGFLSKDSIVLPLLACCLILALITGTLLTVFTAASDRGLQNLPGAGAQPGSTGTATRGPGRPATATTGPGGPAGPTAAGSVTPIAALPAAAVLVGGNRVLLRRLSRAMLVLVPAGCACGPAVSALASVAFRAQARAYLVSATGAAKLARQVDRNGHGTIIVAVDSGHVLNQYRHGLTAVLIGPGHVAAYASHLAVNANFERLRPALIH